MSSLINLISVATSFKPPNFHLTIISLPTKVDFWLTSSTTSEFSSSFSTDLANGHCCLQSPSESWGHQGNSPGLSRLDFVCILAGASNFSYFICRNAFCHWHFYRLRNCEEAMVTFFGMSNCDLSNFKSPTFYSFSSVKLNLSICFSPIHVTPTWNQSKPLIS